MTTTEPTTRPDTPTDDLNVLGAVIPASLSGEVAAMAAEVRALTAEVRPTVERAAALLARSDALADTASEAAGLALDKFAADDATNLVGKLTGTLDLSAALHDLGALVDGL